MPKISVIIPTFNRPEFLAKAISSIVQQTYKDFEIIVVQNGPVEHSKSIAEKFTKQGVPLRYFYEIKADAVNARNVGIRESRGGFVAFLDDDDEWLPKKLEQQLELMESSESIGLVFSHPLVVTENGEMISEKLRSGGLPNYKRLVVKGNLIRSLSGILVRRICFDNVGYLNPRYSICNDYDFYLRMVRRYQIRMTEEAQYRYHFHKGNLSKDVLLGRHEVVDILRLLEPAPNLGVTQSLLQKVIRKHARYCCGAAVDAQESKNYSLAFKCYFAGLCHEPFVGLRIRWGRFKNPLYHFFRPYFALTYCGFKSLFVSQAVKV